MTELEKNEIKKLNIEIEKIEKVWPDNGVWPLAWGDQYKRSIQNRYYLAWRRKTEILVSYMEL